MTFNFKISKWANFYFFVQNLSEWHPRCRKGYNVFWKKRLGELSEQENSALEKFKGVRSKHPDNQSFFEEIFFLSDNPLAKLEQYLSNDECKQIEGAFTSLEGKFNILFEKELERFKMWQQKLAEEMNKEEKTNDITGILNILYKTSIEKKDVDVYLLFSVPGSIGGGANIDNKSISIEISNYTAEGGQRPAGFIWHEIIHLVFQSPHFHPLLREYFANDRTKFAPVNEIITASLFPDGVLGEKFMDLKNITASLFYGMNHESIEKTLKLTNKYIKEKRGFDTEYIKELEQLYFCGK